MRVLVVYCHPDETSYASSLHSAVIESLSASGHTVMDLDLYGERFNPVLTLKDRIEYDDSTRHIKSVEKYARQLAAAEAIVAVYPTWWYGLPAMLKGYFDRVWAPGIAYDLTAEGSVDTSRLAHIRRIAVVTTYGAPWWLIRFYMGDPEHKLWGRGVRQLCARGCRLDWHAQYNMDKANPAQLERFLGGVKRRMAAW
jgi:putative NADPH-quinone reductase